jgi:GNAT superfamily N-acetyltransferase
MVIRNATIDDVDAIVRLSNAGGPDGKPRTELPVVLPAGYREAFAKIAGDPKVELMVATIDDAVIGTFHVTYLTYLTGAGREDAQIEAVHVAEAMRGRGIGREMMSWAIERARTRGCRRVQLTTDKRRGDAHRFYARLGFVASHEGMKLSFVTGR